MEGSFNNTERRRYPRVFVDLPSEYKDMNDSYLRGAIVGNASEGGFFIESARDLPVGMELGITVLFPKEYKLDHFKVVAKIVWKKSHQKEDSNGSQSLGGYQYGLEFMQMSDEDRWKLNLLLGGRFQFEENFVSLICQL
jgi:hypothetical protein